MKNYEKNKSEGESVKQNTKEVTVTGYFHDGQCSGTALQEPNTGWSSDSGQEGQPGITGKNQR